MTFVEQYGAWLRVQIADLTRQIYHYECNVSGPTVDEQHEHLIATGKRIAFREALARLQESSITEERPI